ncbi:UTRA domain-containing protein [Streptomyces noursei]|uniref:UTRA domain-containing protein n=1 Tax=Streptomyces noursei TaxID=1971 RepID=UPI003811B66F
MDDNLEAFELPRARPSHTPLPDQISDAEQPIVTRMNLIGPYAVVFERDEDDAADAFLAEHLLHDPNTGARITQRVILPVDVIADFPQLAKTPDAPLPEIHARLAEAGDLTWRETVTARLPLPDEQAVFGIADGGPILVTRRVTYSGDRPLVCEELNAAAEHVKLTYEGPA